MIVRGYAKKPTSAIVAEVVKGFVDNPFLKNKVSSARSTDGKLRRDTEGNLRLPNPHTPDNEERTK